MKTDNPEIDGLSRPMTDETNRDKLPFQAIVMKRRPEKSSSMLYHDVSYSHNVTIHNSIPFRYCKDSNKSASIKVTEEKPIDSPHNRDQPEFLPTRRVRRFI